MKESQGTENSREEALPGLRAFWEDESGVGVVEIILIMVVLIALIVIFRDQLTEIVEKIFGGIQSGVDSIVK
ncbi:MAG: holin, BlyA family protein [Lachnospiraceae bacterium]|nr:holin, BlyA family protein [Lachnospiraceae bacterium]